MSAPSTETLTRLYCANCRFFNAGTNKEFGRCGAPKAESTALPRFIAAEFDIPPFASTMRATDIDCGHDAKWFEAKKTYETAASALEAAE